MALLTLFSVGLWTFAPEHGTWFPLRVAPNYNAADKPFNWGDLSKTKPYLDYSTCYDGEYQCARLELPIDYWNGTTNATLSLAVIKKPAVVPVTHHQYGGPILLNPGGPGGSGISLMLGASQQIREIVDSDDGKYFDLMSFDPRGVALSTPSVQCFDDPVSDLVWQTRLLEEGVFSSSDAAFGRIWSMAAAYSGSCTLPRTDRLPDIKQYVSTASVARDMLEIVERHGEWREKEAKGLREQHKNCQARESRKRATTPVDIPEVYKYKAGEEKINYLGFSYGTYLGNTFAAMYPDRINRLVVDGVVDAYDYKKTLWFDNLVDTEKDLDTFYFHCARVGWPTCALGNETGHTTTEGVKQRLYNITQSVYHNPLPIIDERRPDVVTYSNIKLMIFGALYSPIEAFPFITDLMAGVERGDVNGIAKLLQADHALPWSLGSESAFWGTSSLEWASKGGLGQDATLAIACGDGDSQNWVTREDFREHVKRLAKLSPSVGEIWGNLRLQCIHYHVRPFSRFEGPWVGNTSHPILEIGNTADPVTPGRFAKKMAEGFPGAGFLLQDSAGHCSPSTPSRCTEGYVHQYFQTGEIPEFGTVCKADAVPFGPGPDDSNAVLYDVEVVKTRERQKGIAQALYASGGLGQLSAPWFH